jgi:hypothetical protein
MTWDPLPPGHHTYACWLCHESLSPEIPHQCPTRPEALQPVPAGPPSPAWAQEIRSLPDAVRLLPLPDVHQHCALCGKRGVVATNGAQLACVACMPRLGTGEPAAHVRVPVPRRRRRVVVGLVLGGVLLGSVVGMRGRHVPQARTPVEVRRGGEGALLPQVRYVREVTPEEGY